MNRIKAHQCVEHSLIIEVSGESREFVFPFDVTATRPAPAKVDSIMANKAILIFGCVDEPTTRTITLRGSGCFDVSSSHPSFDLARGLFDENGRLSLNGDKSLGVKFKPGKREVETACLSLTSTSNARTKSKIPLVGIPGRPKIMVNNKPITDGPVAFGQEPTILTNAGNFTVRCYIVAKNEVANYCLKPNEKQTVCYKESFTMYIVSETMRKIVAKLMQKDSGRRTMELVLKKAKSEKLVMLDFSMEPRTGLSDEIMKAESELLRAFLQNIETVHFEHGPVSKPIRKVSLGSIDSVPTKVNDFLVSTRNIDFGLVKPKTPHIRYIEISNSEKEAQAWLIQRKPSDTVPSPYTISQCEGVLPPGGRQKIEVKFQPRKDGVFRQDLILEYHSKVLLGLAATIKKETILISGAAKAPQFKMTVNGETTNEVRFSANDIKKAADLGETSVITKIRCENRAKETVKMMISNPEDPFQIGNRDLSIKSRDIRFDWTSFFDSLCESSVIESSDSPDEFVELEHD